MVRVITLILLWSVLWQTPAAAGELFRYVDDMGTVNYVDSIAKVPERYRLQLLTPEERARLENTDTTRVLLFPYELIGSDILQQGLWEDAHERPISRAKAVYFTRGTARIQKISRYKIHFEHENSETESLVVFKVNVKAPDFTDLKGNPVRYESLSGFMLKSRMPKEEP